MIANIEWKSISEPPKRNGYVLLAVMHHGIPYILMGHCNFRNGSPDYKQDVFNSGVTITHWAKLPKHPLGKSIHEEMDEDIET